MNPNELAGFLVSVLRGSKDERHFYVFETPEGPHRVIVERFSADERQTDGGAE